MANEKSERKIIMDYENKYKNALERAKKELDVCGSQDCDAARQIFRLFPELKEDKDERIRRELIRLVYTSYNQLFPYTPTKEEYEEMTAWLEKQGKQKADCSEEDEKIRKEIISALKFANHKGVYDKHIAWLEKQGEQDTIETQSKEFDDNIITNDDEILRAISIGLTDIIEDFGWPEFGGLPIEEIQSWLDKQSKKKLVISDNALKEG